MPAPQTVLITGCSTGIGRALTETLAHRGYHVFATARNVDRLSGLERDNVTCLALDVTDPESINTAMASIADKGLGLNILINNAGYGAMGPVLELSDAELHQQFDTNVLAVISMTRACLPLLRQNGGTVVNIGSVSGVLTTPFSGVYCATKAAVHALSDALRMELAPFHIRVMTVQPGAIESEFGNNAEAALRRNFDASSNYHPIQDSVVARARASQQNPTTASDFAAELAEYLDSPTPPAVVTIGNGSTLMPLMARWLPIKAKDRLLSRKFNLDKLAQNTD